MIRHSESVLFRPLIFPTGTVEDVFRHGVCSIPYRSIFNVRKHHVEAYPEWVILSGSKM